MRRSEIKGIHSWGLTELDIKGHGAQAAEDAANARSVAYGLFEAEFFGDVHVLDRCFEETDFDEVDHKICAFKGFFSAAGVERFLGLALFFKVGVHDGFDAFHAFGVHVHKCEFAVAEFVK